MPCVISRAKITRGIYSRFLCENVFLSACHKITSVHAELSVVRKKKNISTKIKPKEKRVSSDRTFMFEIWRLVTKNH